MPSLLSSKQTPNAPQGSVEVIRCGVGEEIYCLEMSAVASVNPAGDLRPNPAQDASGSVGLMAYRRQEIPVFDLAAVLDRSCSPTKNGHYIVLINHPARPYGLRVENVSRVIRLPHENVLPLPKALDHTGSCFRGIADFTRERQVDWQVFSARHLPGLSEPRQVPSNRRRRQHQMQLVLNTKTLLSDAQAKSDPPLPAENLLRRYATVDALGQRGGVRQLVVFPAGVVGDRQILMGLSISQVAEISEPLTLIPVPKANETILGLAHWRNCPVPVLNPQAFLPTEHTAEVFSHWVVAREHQTKGLVVLPVAGRIQSMRLPIAHRPCAVPDARWNPFVLGAFEFEERILIIPRLDALSGVS